MSSSFSSSADLKIGWSNKLYQSLARWADRPEAALILGGVAFCSSIFFPIPPDPLFGLVALQKRRQIPFLVLWVALAAALGGVVMYGIGYGLFEVVGRRILDFYGWNAAFQSVQDQLHQWGAWILVIKAFTPIPYKLISLAYGVGHFDPWIFFTASFLGRGGRYGLEGVLIWFLGPSLRPLLERYLRPLLLLFAGVVLLGFAALTFLPGFFKL